MTRSSTWLLVDDEATFLRSMESACLHLAEELSARPEAKDRYLVPAVIRTAASARAALEEIGQHPPDFLITDLRMPEVDGYQLVRLVQRQFPGIRKVILTGAAIELTPQALESAGVDFVFRKPRSQQELTHMFEAICRLGIALRPPSPQSKPNGVRAASRVTGRITDPRRPQPRPEAPEDANSGSGFRGELPGIGLMELMQMLVLSGNASLLEIASDGGLGRIWLQHGRVLHAESATVDGLLEGPPAVDWIFDQAGGQFRLQPFTTPPRLSLNEPGDHFLMEAARRLDERSRNALPVRSVTRHTERRVTVIEETVQEEINVAVSTPSAPAADQVQAEDEAVVVGPGGQILAHHNCARPGARADLADFFRFKRTFLTKGTGLGEVRSALFHGPDGTVWVGFDADLILLLLSPQPMLTQDALRARAAHLPCLCPTPQLLP